MPMLDAMLAARIRLIDYEKMVDAEVRLHNPQCIDVPRAVASLGSDALQAMLA